MKLGEINILFIPTHLVEHGNVKTIRHGKYVPVGEFQGGLVTQDAEGAVRTEPLMRKLARSASYLDDP